MVGTPVQLAYPGVWLRDDVYATHGHYLDCHSEVRDVRMQGDGRRGASPQDRPRRLPVAGGLRGERSRRCTG